MAWSPVRHFNAGWFEIDHPGDYATLNSYQPRDATGDYPRRIEMSEYVYIDGGYLRKRVAGVGPRYYGADGFELDYSLFFRRFEKKFYYDSLPSRRESESEEEFRRRTTEIERFFDRIRELPGFHVYLGKTVSQGDRSRQKGVDVQLAVHMLSHAFRRIAQRGTLVAGDADFQPLAEAVVQEGMYLSLWSERRTTARALIHSVDAYERFQPYQWSEAAQEDFKTKYQRPSDAGESGKRSEGYALIKRGKFQNGQDVELYQGPDDFMMVYQLGTHVRHVRHKRDDCIQNFVEDLLDWKVSW
jgi:uncharacterized LabA/DUF88 family protein